MTPEVSVIIPTRDRSALLPRAIESVLQQTSPSLELIVVDDGSQDDTEEICGRYTQESRFRYHRGCPRGVSAARNLGIRTARAEWLAFLDSDDLWMPAKLDRQLACIQRTQDKICHTDEVWIRRGRRVNPKKKHRKPEGWVFEACLPLCAISPSSAMVHRSVFSDVGYFDESYEVCEDYEFWLRATPRYRVSLVEEPLITKFGGHADQLSRKFWGMDRWRVRALYSFVLDLSLRPDWRGAASDEMERKLKVLIQGYAKRGRQATAQELTHFRDAVRRWLMEKARPSEVAETAPLFPACLIPETNQT